MAIRVYLVDDHALVRTGMKMILAQEVDIEVVGEADSGEAALPAIRALKPDVVLCDLHLPGISGLEITERQVTNILANRRGFMLQAGDEIFDAKTVQIWN